jgi:hypothetical protein
MDFWEVAIVSVPAGVSAAVVTDAEVTVAIAALATTKGENSRVEVWTSGEPQRAASLGRAVAPDLDWNSTRRVGRLARNIMCTGVVERSDSGELDPGEEPDGEVTFNGVTALGVKSLRRRRGSTLYVDGV